VLVLKDIRSFCWFKRMHHMVQLEKYSNAWAYRLTQIYLVKMILHDIDLEVAFYTHSAHFVMLAECIGVTREDESPAAGKDEELGSRDA